MLKKYSVLLIPVCFFILISVIVTLTKQNLLNIPAFNHPLLLSILAFSGIASILAAGMVVYEAIHSNIVNASFGFIKNPMLRNWLAKFIFVMILFLIGALGYGWIIPNPLNTNATLPIK